MPTDIERVLVDTNVLLTAYDPARIGCLDARALLENDPRDLIVAAQSFREFLAVTTRAEAANGYGLDGPTATAAWRSVTSTITLVTETLACQTLLAELVDTGLASSQPIHDAHLVAIALEHRADAIITSNVRHFERFSGLIRIESLPPS